MAIKAEKLKDLQDPKVYKELGIKYSWRPRQITGGKAYMTPYVNARDVQKLFDHVCGIENWNNEPMNINGKLYMSISINIDGDGWIPKSDVGTETKIEAIKGESSDALKRAASMWGAFREKYDLPEKVLGAKGKYPVTKSGAVLVSGQQQSNYCNGISSGVMSLLYVYNSNKEAFNSHPDAVEALSILKNFLTEIDG